MGLRRTNTHENGQLHERPLAQTPTACFLEHMPWAEELFRERLELADGQAVVPDRPGIGFTWDEATIRRFLADGG
jgi:mandelate racemase